MIGVVSFMCALAIPYLADARARSLGVRSQSNIRQLGLGVAGYAGDNKDLPPVLGGGRPSDGWSFQFQTYSTDNWFAHKWLFSLAITRYLEDVRVAAAPGNPNPRKILTVDGERASLSDYSLSPTLYATPSFFSWDTQKGPSQFGAQRLDQIAHPSDKGVLNANWIYHIPKYGPTPTCCVFDVASPVCFGDLSVSEHVIRRMRPGMMNIYDKDVVLGGGDPVKMQGPPVTGTLDGVSGRDKW